MKSTSTECPSMHSTDCYRRRRPVLINLFQIQLRQSSQTCLLRCLAALSLVVLSEMPRPIASKCWETNEKQIKKMKNTCRCCWSFLCVPWNMLLHMWTKEFTSNTKQSDCIPFLNLVDVFQMKLGTNQVLQGIKGSK